MIYRLLKSGEEILDGDEFWYNAWVKTPEEDLRIATENLQLPIGEKIHKSGRWFESPNLGIVYEYHETQFFHFPHRRKTCTDS